jgi:glyoxylase-like metal-dependent hydrolase (beta-lactamase superfamily II)
LIDPGLRTEEALQVWDDTMKQLRIDFADIQQIVLTHHHPDHYGLAGWFQEHTGAPVWLSAEGQMQVRRLWGEGQPLTEELHALFVRHGMSGEHEAAIVPHMNRFVEQVAPQPVIQTIKAGEPFQLGDRRCLAIHTPGHALGHICFYDEERREMFCGDHVLPQISPNISYLPGVDPNPLASFLGSLEEISRYEVQRAYPGHRDPFSTFTKRIEELVVHHQERLRLIRHKLAILPMSAYTLCMDLFGMQLTIHQLRFAMAETLAHLIWLKKAGQVVEIERDGIIVFSSSSG